MHYENHTLMLRDVENENHTIGRIKRLDVSLSQIIIIILLIFNLLDSAQSLSGVRV